MVKPVIFDLISLQFCIEGQALCWKFA